MESIINDVAIAFSYSFVVVSCKSIDVDKIGIIILSKALCSICENN
jgi:hypothetical protein